MAEKTETYGEFVQDIEEIRRRARQHIEDGAVTEEYKANRETVIDILNQALATEIVCTLRYKRHYYTARGIHARPVAEEFLEHAREEQEHADRIAERITQLGGEPDYDPQGLATRSHSEYVEGADLAEMVREDLVAERIAIASYTGIVKYLGDRDSTTRRLMEEVLAKEEEHADDLAEILSNLGSEQVEAGESVGGGEEEEEIQAGGGPMQAASEDLPLPHDLGYGRSHGYNAAHGGPSSPGDAPAPGPGEGEVHPSQGPLHG